MSNYPTLSGQNTCYTPTAQPRTAMPENMSQFDYSEIRQAVDAYNESHVAHQLNQLDYILNSNMILSQWEIDLANKVLQKFAAKYNSPLAQETK